jgi:hypothetical protein
MTTDHALTALSAALCGYGLCHLLVRARLAAPPQALIRVNVNGRPVPAVLGGALSISGLAALAGLAMAAGLGWEPARMGRLGVAAATCIGVMAIAGSWDDRRGDERPRGFRGHLAAARGGALTGGVLKLAAGGLAGVVGGILAASGWAIVEVAALVALTANLVNLFDRAPGRAAKVAIVIAVPLVVAGSATWVIAASGTLGALVAALSFDLAERAMLGDAGANPVGALLGLGLAASMPEGARLVAIVVLVALNLASERWSFSRVIEATPWLEAFDMFGRRSAR